MTVHVDEQGSWSAAYRVRRCEAGHSFVQREVECPVCAIRRMCLDGELRAIDLVLREYLTGEQRSWLATALAKS